MVIYTLKVVDVRRETRNAVTLSFKQPSLKKVKYRAGQYLTLIFRINGRRYIRPYSFSSAPSVDALLEITVKRVINGLVSNHINDLVKIGDSIEVMHPMGEFFFNNENIEEVFLWGIGSGITPLISIIKELLLTNHSIKINLILGNKDEEQTIFFQSINLLILKYQNRFKVWHFHTQISEKETSPFVILGRINHENINKIQGVNFDKALHYICGPKGLKNTVNAFLYKFQVPSSNIFSEDFELVKNPDDFEDVNTQKIKLKFMHKLYDLEVVKGKSVLESALDADIELPYSCQTGNCNTCRGKLVKGKIKMVGLNKDRADLLPDEYLLCCTYPISDDIYLEVN